VRQSHVFTEFDAKCGEAADTPAIPSFFGAPTIEALPQSPGNQRA
jgi:hypothetical protein